MIKKLKNIKELATEVRKELVLENMKIDLHENLNELFDEIDTYYEEFKSLFEKRKVSYYERKVDLESGTSFNSLLGHGQFIELGLKNFETSAIIKTEKGYLLNLPLKLVKFS